MSDDYITTPTRIRVFWEGNQWSIDGVDDAGGYTEAVWDHYDGETMSKAKAIAVAKEFAAEHGWGGLPVEVREDDDA